MVLPLLIAPILEIATATALGQIIAGPLTEILAGVVPHQNPSVRLLVASYVSGAITRNEFINTKAITHLEPDEQQDIIKYADKMIENKNASVLTSQSKEILKGLENASDDYVKLSLDEPSKEIKDIDNESEKLKRDILKLATDEKEFEINHAIDGMNLDIRILEKAIPSAKPVKEPTIPKVVPVTEADFTRVIKSLLPSIYVFLQEQNLDISIDNVMESLTTGIPKLNVFTDEQLKFIEQQKFFSRVRSDVFMDIQSFLEKQSQIKPTSEEVVA